MWTGSGSRCDPWGGGQQQGHGQPDEAEDGDQPPATDQGSPVVAKFHHSSRPQKRNQWNADGHVKIPAWHPRQTSSGWCTPALQDAWGNPARAPPSEEDPDSAPPSKIGPTELNRAQCARQLAGASRRPERPRGRCAGLQWRRLPAGRDAASDTARGGSPAQLPPSGEADTDAQIRRALRIDGRRRRNYGWQGAGLDS